MRLAVCVFVACGSLLTAGCASKPASPPIVSGQLVSVTLWEKPVQRAGETGSNSGSPVKEGRVDVYDQFIVVTLPNGTRLLSLHGWYTGLTFK